jgi:hypothetical protein
MSWIMMQYNWMFNLNLSFFYGTYVVSDGTYVVSGCIRKYRRVLLFFLSVRSYPAFFGEDQDNLQPPARFGELAPGATARKTPGRLRCPAGRVALGHGRARPPGCDSTCTPTSSCPTVAASSSPSTWAPSNWFRCTSMVVSKQTNKHRFCKQASVIVQSSTRW